MATAAPAVTPPTPPLEGDLRDVGGARRASVRARSYTALGAVKLLGDLEAGPVELHGLASIGGRLTAEKLRSDGTLDVAGAVVVKGEVSVKGTAILRAGLSSGDLTVHGHLLVTGATVSDGNARVHGHLEAAGNLTARSLQFDGGVSVAGLVDSPIVEGRLRRASRIGTLKAQHLRIVRAPPPFGSRGSLIVDRIEATEVELEGVECEYLRADRVRLGADSHVTRLDGQVVRRHRTATVGPRSWEPAPPGMSR